MLGFITEAQVSQLLLSICAVSAAWCVAGMIVQFINGDIYRFYFWLQMMVGVLLLVLVSMLIIAFFGLPIP